jgi:hypothetical protein
MRIGLTVPSLINWYSMVRPIPSSVAAWWAETSNGRTPSRPEGMLTRVGNDRGTVGAFELIGRSANTSPFFHAVCANSGSVHTERVDRSGLYAGVRTVHRVGVIAEHCNHRDRCSR